MLRAHQDEEEAVFAADAEDAAQAGERDEGADADQNDADRLETGEVLCVVRDVGVGHVRQPRTPTSINTELHNSVIPGKLLYVYFLPFSDMLVHACTFM